MRGHAGRKIIRYEIAAAPGVASCDWGLIWAHGLTGSAANESEGGWPYGEVVELANLLPVARYDARGHGRSDDPDIPDDAERLRSQHPLSWPVMGGDLTELRAAWGKRKTILAGTSMGSAASIYSLLEDTSDVAGLILANPPTCYGTRSQFVPQYLASLEVTRADGIESAYRAAQQRAKAPIFLESERGRQMFEIGWRQKFEMGTAKYCNALEGAIRSDLPDQGRIKAGLENVPTLILAWKTDAQHPVETARMLHELLPRSELVVASSWAEVEEFPHRMRLFVQRLMDEAGN